MLQLLNNVNVADFNAISAHVLNYFVLLNCRPIDSAPRQTTYVYVHIYMYVYIEVVGLIMRQTYRQLGNPLMLHEVLVVTAQWLPDCLAQQQQTAVETITQMQLPILLSYISSQLFPHTHTHTHTVRERNIHILNVDRPE